MKPAHHPTQPRLTGRRATLIAVVAGLVLAPTAAYAADRFLSVIADPYDSTAMARVSGDGRLGMRGETTAQQGVQSNAWNAIVHALNSDSMDLLLLRAAPAGGGLGVGQLTVTWWSRATSPGSTARAASDSTILQVIRALAPPGGCAYRRSIGVEYGYEVIYQVMLPTPPDEHGYAQLQFPVPLTPRASADRGTCLYVRSFPRDVWVSANGVEGLAVPAFAPAKGESPATPPPGEPD